MLYDVLVEETVFNKFGTAPHKDEHGDVDGISKYVTVFDDIDDTWEFVKHRIYLAQCFKLQKNTELIVYRHDADHIRPVFFFVACCASVKPKYTPYNDRLVAGFYVEYCLPNPSGLYRRIFDYIGEKQINFLRERQKTPSFNCLLS